MDLRQQHRDLIGVPADGLAHLGYLLTEEERRFLNKYGAWLEALAKGAIQPLSPEQSAFVRVAAGEAEPSAFAELLWLKWCSHYNPWKARQEAIVELATERAQRVLEQKLAAKAAATESSNRSSSDVAFPLICNACGSDSPNLCRCSQ